MFFFPLRPRQPAVRPHGDLSPKLRKSCAAYPPGYPFDWQVLILKEVAGLRPAVGACTGLLCNS